MKYGIIWVSPSLDGDFEGLSVCRWSRLSESNLKDGRPDHFDDGQDYIGAISLQHYADLSIV